MGQILNLLFYQPIFNLLVAVYSLVPNLGWTTILVTLLIRFLMWPWYRKNARLQRQLSLIQPKIKEIQKKYKDDPQQQMKELSNLYRLEKVNPLGMILFLLVQIFVLLALFKDIGLILAHKGSEFLYPFVSHKEITNYLFLSIDLSQPHFLLALLAALTQYLQSWLMLRRQKKLTSQNPQVLNQTVMFYLMPLLVFFLYLKLPAVLALYWLIMTIVSIVQDLIVWRESVRIAVGNGQN